jgi:hypothetical protein
MLHVTLKSCLYMYLQISFLQVKMLQITIDQFVFCAVADLEGLQIGFS